MLGTITKFTWYKIIFSVRKSCCLFLAIEGRIISYTQRLNLSLIICWICYFSFLLRERTLFKAKELLTKLICCWYYLEWITFVSIHNKFKINFVCYLSLICLWLHSYIPKGLLRLFNLWISILILDLEFSSIPWTFLSLVKCIRCFNVLLKDWHKDPLRIQKVFHPH